MGVHVLCSKWIWPLRVRGFSEMNCDVKTNAFRCVVLEKMDKIWSWAMSQDTIVE